MSAAAPRAQEEDIPSPCINVCRMDAANRFCEGCRRSLEEIAGWSIYTPEQKRAVLVKLRARVQAP